MGDTVTADVGNAKILHPSFMTKIVYNLDCVFCLSTVCSRGMKAILLADTKTEMYSTDQPLKCAIDTVGSSYCTEKCSCKIKDIACTHCGNAVGYRVYYPCRQCLLSCNNGHYWMYNSDMVTATERLNEANTGCTVQCWGDLPVPEEDVCCDYSFMEECLR